MADRTDRTPKQQALRQTGTLNPRPDRLIDESFADSDFFDRNDLLQVKYEMLRRVARDDVTVRQAAQLFGFSCRSFYQAQEAFTCGGLGALVPQKRGPRRAHKLSQKVVAFIEGTIAADPGADLVAAVQQAFGISVHRRSIERALARAKKNDATDDRSRSHGRF
jgi:transposase